MRLLFKVTDKRVNGQIPSLPNAYECQLARVALRSNTPKVRLPFTDILSLTKGVKKKRVLKTEFYLQFSSQQILRIAI